LRGAINLGISNAIAGKTGARRRKIPIKIQSLSIGAPHNSGENQDRASPRSITHQVRLLALWLTAIQAMGHILP
jgi:hypothetical protein